jgi:hypothetical protein
MLLARLGLEYKLPVLKKCVKVGNNKLILHAGEFLGKYTVKKC